LGSSTQPTSNPQPKATLQRQTRKQTNLLNIAANPAPKKKAYDSELQKSFDDQEAYGRNKKQNLGNGSTQIEWGKGKQSSSKKQGCQGYQITPRQALSTVYTIPARRSPPPVQRSPPTAQRQPSVQRSTISTQRSPPPASRPFLNSLAHVPVYPDLPVQRSTISTQRSPPPASRSTLSMAKLTLSDSISKSSGLVKKLLTKREKFQMALDVLPAIQPKRSGLVRNCKFFLSRRPREMTEVEIECSDEEFQMAFEELPKPRGVVKKCKKLLAKTLTRKKRRQFEDEKTPQQGRQKLQKLPDGEESEIAQETFFTPVGSEIEEMEQDTFVTPVGSEMEIEIPPIESEVEKILLNGWASNVNEEMLDNNYPLRDEVSTFNTLIMQHGFQLRNHPIATVTENIVQFVGDEEHFNEIAQRITIGTPMIQLLYDDDDDRGFAERPFADAVEAIGHYVVAYNNGTDNVVHVYDSLNRDFLSGRALKALKMLFYDRIINVEFHEVQQQADGSSCGVHAVANYVTLMSGGDPSSVRINSNMMRTHMYNMLRTGNVSAFPREATREGKLYFRHSD
jgi:hypothetical protein